MWSTNGTLETSTKINIKQGQIGIPCTTEMIIVYSISKCAVSCILMSFDQYVVLSMDGSPVKEVLNFIYTIYSNV